MSANQHTKKKGLVKIPFNDALILRTVVTNDGTASASCRRCDDVQPMCTQPHYRTCFL